ncbi:MAG: hypothetical protein IT518_15715 [Burkholderiales bacterium]|nr:hypothetical protein [Burkholderiales bacterium]
MRNACSKLCMLLVVLFSLAAAAQPPRCDADGNGVVNQDDLRAIIAAAANATAVLRGDPRDADGDGRVTPVDVLVCMAACNLWLCRSVNIPPSADAGADQTAAPGATVHLSGAQSTDPDGPQPLTYRWWVKERPPGSHVRIAQANTVSPWFVPDKPGRGAAAAQYKANDGTADSNTVDVTLNVTPGLPTVTITATDANASEIGPDPGVFTFTRTGPTTFDLTVGYSIGGTAGSGVDYAGLTGSVIILAGQATATVAITPITDSLGEGDETVTLTINASPATYVVGAPASATVTITPGADGASDPGETVILTIAPNPTAYLVGSPSSATVIID